MIVNWLAQGHIRFRVTYVSYSISTNQENGLIDEVQELFVIGDRIVEDLPDGTHVSLQIKSFNEEYEKDDNGDLILGYLPKLDEDVWHLICLMRNENIREIRESFRHWQKTKIGEIFCYATLTGKPEEVQDQGHAWLRDIKLSFPEAKL